MITAKILADSMNVDTGDRLTTFELEYPYVIHAQFMTHRMFSRNAQSSRAIPVDKLVARVTDNPYIPEQFHYNQRGMVPSGPLTDDHNKACRLLWKRALHKVLDEISDLQNFDVHKQWVNRLLMTWQHIKVICTGTDYAYSNFFSLRCAPDAQHEIQELANAIKEAYEESCPSLCGPGDYHLPLVYGAGDEDCDLETRKRLSIARCARVSYLTHEGQRDLQRDLDLYERLLNDRHMSPFEHVAVAAGGTYANYTGWRSVRYEVER